MRNNEKRFIKYAVVILPASIILVFGFLTASFYYDKLTTYLEETKLEEIKLDSDFKKQKSKLFVEKIYKTYEQHYNKIQKDIEKELEEKIAIAYKAADEIYRKNKGIKSDKKIKREIKNLMMKLSWGKEQNYIFIKNFHGDAIVSLAKNEIDIDYMDADARTIVLEQIQKVRKRGEGFLYSKYAKDEPQEIYFVKKLDMYDWFIGTKIQKKERYDILKDSLLEVMKMIPLDKDYFISLRDSNNEIYKSSQVKNQEYIYSQYFEPLDTYIEYGYINTTQDKKYENTQIKLEEEYKHFIKGLSFTTVLFIIFIFILLQKKYFYRNKI